MADYRSARSTHILTSHLAGGSNHGTRLLTSADGDPLTEDAPLIYDADGNVVSGSFPAQTVSVAKAGTLVGTRGRINFIEGSNVTITATDDAGNNEIDVTIASSGGGGAPTNYPTNVPFVDSGFSWVNQGSASKTTSGDIFILETSTTANNSFHLYVEAVPSTPYKLWTRILAYGRGVSANQIIGICWYDSGSGKFLFMGIRQNGSLAIYGATQVTPTPTFTEYYNSTFPLYAYTGGAIAFGMEDDGTNKDFVFCSTLEHSRIMYRFTSSEYLTPTDYGIFIAQGAGTSTHMEVLSYDNY